VKKPDNNNNPIAGTTGLFRFVKGYPSFGRHLLMAATITFFEAK
jgi:hypothetical protein